MRSLFHFKEQNYLHPIEDLFHLDRNYLESYKLQNHMTYKSG